MRAFIICLFLLALPAVAQAQILELASSDGFDRTVERVEQAIEANGMFRIATASASRAAAEQSITISGDAVILVFRNDFARRILAADPAAGIEAPLPIHVRGVPGGALVSWKRPSDVYARYRQPTIDDAARELDAIFAKIVSDAVAR